MVKVPGVPVAFVRFGSRRNVPLWFHNYPLRLKFGREGEIVVEALGESGSPKGDFQGPELRGSQQATQRDDSNQHIS
jgi:hypothetical protein